MINFLPISVYEAPPFPEEVFVLPQIEIVIPQKRSLTQKISITLALLGILFLVISYGPSLWFALRGTDRVSALLSSTTELGPVKTDNVSSWQPSFDKKLPLENKIIIPTVGIETVIHEAKSESYEDALSVGVWRVNDFGTPYDRHQPTILTAHRFGYLAWSLNFRLHESFYELPKLKVGDTLSIIWRQRKYTYAVYKSEENEEITDYSADLILYTCRDLTSNIREIKYARLIEI